MEGYKEVVGAEFWMPNTVGDTLKGEVIAIIDGQFGKQYDIRKEDGAKIRTPSHRVLQSKMSEAKTGDNVVIEYSGEELPKVKGNDPTKMYKIFVRE